LQRTSLSVIIIHVRCQMSSSFTRDLWLRIIQRGEQVAVMISVSETKHCFC
jgi:hypothetical protein